MGRITNSIENNIVDFESGEIKYKETTRTINWGKEPEFVKLYLNDVLYLSDLPKGLNSILYAFIKRMHYGNELVLNAALKRAIAKELKLSVSSINNAISKFVKGKLLIRIDTGMYLVNPQLFGKGEWKDIAKIRLSATYDLNGRTIMAEIDRDTDEGREAQKQAFHDKYHSADEEQDLDAAQKLYEEFEENRDDELEYRA